MKILVVYESMYGNTHHVAETIGERLQAAGEVQVVSVEEAAKMPLDDIGLLVVGGPTHAHGMTRPSTRANAVDAAHKPDSDLVVDEHAYGEGLREWLDELPRTEVAAAAFDTRMSGPPAFTGRASKGIGRKLHQLGATQLVEPESFIVDHQNHLAPGEDDHARRWAQHLAEELIVHQAATS